MNEYPIYEHHFLLNEPVLRSIRFPNPDGSNRRIVYSRFALTMRDLADYNEAEVENGMPTVLEGKNWLAVGRAVPVEGSVIFRPNINESLKKDPTTPDSELSNMARLTVQGQKIPTILFDLIAPPEFKPGPTDTYHFFQANPFECFLLFPVLPRSEELERYLMGITSRVVRSRK
jgi:hypothetical protein